MVGRHGRIQATAVTPGTQQLYQASQLVLSSIRSRALRHTTCICSWDGKVSLAPLSNPADYFQTALSNRKNRVKRKGKTVENGKGPISAAHENSCMRPPICWRRARRRGMLSTQRRPPWPSKAQNASTSLTANLASRIWLPCFSHPNASATRPLRPWLHCDSRQDP